MKGFKFVGKWIKRGFILWLLWPLISTAMIPINAVMVEVWNKYGYTTNGKYILYVEDEAGQAQFMKFPENSQAHNDTLTVDLSNID